MNEISGVLINILRVGDKSSVQRGFFKNSACDILPASRFLGRLYIFYNFVNYIFFNVSLDAKVIEYYQKCAVEIEVFEN